MMQSTDVMVMTTTAIDCVWSFLGVAGAPEVVSVGSVELLGADTGLRPDAQSTGSLCRVSMQSSPSSIWSIYKWLYNPLAPVSRIDLLNSVLPSAR